jgi:hypothetical protein
MGDPFAHPLSSQPAVPSGTWRPALARQQNTPLQMEDWDFDADLPARSSLSPSPSHNSEPHHPATYERALTVFVALDILCASSSTR